LRLNLSNAQGSFMLAECSCGLYGISFTFPLSSVFSPYLSYRLTELVKKYYTAQKKLNDLNRKKIERQLAILGKGAEKTAANRWGLFSSGRTRNAGKRSHLQGKESASANF